MPGKGLRISRLRDNTWFSLAGHFAFQVISMLQRQVMLQSGVE
jgi:hypothetical protein